VAAVDSVTQLPFHLLQLPAFPRPQRPCYDLVHVGSPRHKPAALTVDVENLFIQKSARACLSASTICPSAKLAEWKRHSMLDVGEIADLASDDDPEQIMALDAAVHRLEVEDAQAAQVVKLRFYVGLSIEETARAMGISPRTVKRDWQFARAWLYRTLE
jgi:DNA-directed RNA polymerase specialized sigma24 family protein